MAGDKAPSDMQAAAEISRTMESLRLRAVTAEESWEKTARREERLAQAIADYCANDCKLGYCDAAGCPLYGVTSG